MCARPSVQKKSKKTGAKSYKAEGNAVKAKINNAAWWEKGELLMKMVKPIIELLRHSDSKLPIMGKVYARMSVIATKLEDPAFASRLTQQQRNDLPALVTDRARSGW